MQLSEEELVELGVNSEWVVDVMRYYLTHGTLTTAATALYSPTTFQVELKTMISAGSSPVIRLLKEVVLHRSARARLLALGEEVYLRVIALMNMAAAPRLMPYVNEILDMFKVSGSPVPVALVFEHAVRYALQLHTTVVPLNYVKDFFEFIGVQSNVRVEEAIIWANRRLESSNSSLVNSMLQMIDVVERIESVRKVRDPKKGKEGEKPQRPAKLPKPLESDIYVSNAGVGILYLFIIHLFKACNLVTPDRKAFVDRQSQVRGIHFIQYLCYKEIDSPEEKMVMAKLIVGWPLTEYVDPLETPLTDEDIETCGVIWTNVCNQWGVMKNAGAEYARTNFVVRDGRLKQGMSDWNLRVEESGLDILKRKIPWSTNPIRLPWNEYVIEVEWP